MTLLDVNGVRLNVQVQGDGPALLLLHGFTGSSATWTSHTARFEGFTTVSVDLLGHGDSDDPLAAERYRMERCVEDLTSVMDQLEIERAAVLGYSMGGRVALQFALAAPDRLWALVLESASPGIDDAAERKDRVRSDAALADDIERKGVEAFVDRWEAIPLFASQKRLPADVREELRRQRLRNSTVGLSNSLRGAGAGREAPVLSRLGALRIPALLIAGALDSKYVALANKMNDSLPCARTQIVPDAGHATHLEQPETFDRLVGEFLRTQKRRRRKGGVAVSVTWQRVREFEDIIYEHAEGIAKITINRPELRNAFRPHTISELSEAFAQAHEDANIGVIILTGAGTKAFCSGGDQRVRGDGGYVGDDGVPRLNVLPLQRQIRTIPKPVIAMVAGYAIGGGHVLHVVCDLTIAADNAVFGQTGPMVGSFDAGYGASLLGRLVGEKKAREIWYLCRQYSAKEALEMGLVNAVVPLDQLEEETVKWAQEMLEKSPTALRFLKAAFNADADGLAGLQQLAGDATLLFYMSDEAKEGRDAFLEKRKPDFARFPRLP